MNLKLIIIYLRNDDLIDYENRPGEAAFVSYLKDYEKDLCQEIIENKNFNIEKLKEKVKSFRGFFYGRKYISLEQGNYFDSFGKVDLLVIFRRDDRGIHFAHNLILESYNISNKNWKIIHYENIQNHVLLRHINAESQKPYTYVIFMDTNNHENMELFDYVNNRINFLSQLIYTYLGKYYVEKAAFSMFYTDNLVNDQLILTNFISNLKGQLLANENLIIKGIHLIDLGQGFLDIGDNF